MENSKIAWTDNTFNPWIGCTKVSDGCKFCYAEALMDHRYGKVQWGPSGARQRTSAANWRKPHQWNRQAAKEGRRIRVFCASLADVFEDRDELIPWRADLFAMIEETPNLDWQLLTKRPENVPQMMPELPRNVWLGTSVENQETADLRVPLLAQISAAVRFASYEPALGPIVFNSWWLNEVLSWIIVGGESGHDARPFNIHWARQLVRDCDAAGVPVFVKQLGARPYSCIGSHDSPAASYGAPVDCRGNAGYGCEVLKLKDKKGGDMDEWPEDLRVREMPRLVGVQ